MSIIDKNIARLIALVAVTFGLHACTGDPGATNNQPAPRDMSSEDMNSADMKAPDPSCSTTDDCVGDFAGNHCIDDVCTDCASGDEGCVCRANGTCKSGQRCDRDAGLCVACVDGALDCPCDAVGACGDGLVCEAEVCVEDTCVPGALDCPCVDGESCEGTSYCDESMICRACTSDIAGCPCADDETCSSPALFCADGACAECPDSEKPEGCACEESTECGDQLACDAETRACRAAKTCDELCLPFQLCDSSGAGDPVCVMEMCLVGYLWDGVGCVEEPQVTCDGRDGSMDLTSTCDATQTVCVEPMDGSGAVCVEECATVAEGCAAEARDCVEHVGTTPASCGDCRPGYIDDGAGSCTIDVNLNCSAFDPVNSIADTCRARNQECLEVGGGGASCGDCLDGFVYDLSVNACRELPLCGGEYCEGDEYCSFPQTGGPPSCQAKPCPAGQARDVANDICVLCQITCDQDGVYPTLVDGACECASDVFCSYQFDAGSERCFVSPCEDGEVQGPDGTCSSCSAICGNAEGERARQWPYTTVEDSCFCETQEGFYTPFGGASRPLRCDADQDGWINRTANSTFVSASNINQGAIQRDDAVLANFRCDLRRIDRFTLENELRQRRHVSLCENDLIDYAPGSVPVCNAPDGLTALTLFESDDLDSDNSINPDDTNFPAYGSRKLRASELNSLTKACVGLTGDFNLNGVEDVTEEHAIEKTRIPGLVFSGDNASEYFAFHSMSYFVELHTGRYVQAVVPSDPGEYVISERSRCEPGFALTQFVGGGYWQSCHRARRGDFDYSNSHNGFDFAHWGCAANPNGSCGLPLAPTDASLDDLDADRIPDHGVCDASDPVPDEPWRGMNHHSQFQCVVLKDPLNTTAQYHLSKDLVFEDGEATPAAYEFNDCVAQDCSAAMMGCEETVTQGVYQPRVTQLKCITRERANVVQDQVGWVAARYIPEGVSSSLARPYVRGCVDESYGTDGTDGYSYLCPGYLENPDAVLTAGNPGAHGKLLCSCNRFYGGSNCEVSCVERTGTGSSNGPKTSFIHVGDRDRGYDPERIAEYACSDQDNYCSLHPPVPAESFAGGRRGYWMCGENVITKTVDGSGQSKPFLEGSGSVDAVQKNYNLRGAVKIAPVKRELLKGSGDVDSVTKSYELF